MLGAGVHASIPAILHQQGGEGEDGFDELSVSLWAEVEAIQLFLRARPRGLGALRLLFRLQEQMTAKGGCLRSLM